MKVQGLSENRDLSENRGPSENGACLHRKVQAAAGGGEAYGRQKMLEWRQLQSAVPKTLTVVTILVLLMILKHLL